jgi:hypothetical protein
MYSLDVDERRHARRPVGRHGEEKVIAREDDAAVTRDQVDPV